MPYRAWEVENPYVFFVDQRKHAVLAEMGSTPGQLKGGSGVVYKNYGIMWDSGAPVFSLINDRAALNFTFTGSTGGPSYCDYITQIQNQIIAWGSSNVLDVVDLSEFIDY